MPLSPDEIALIRASHAALLPKLEEASARFYERLFEIAPELRPLFRGDINDQGMKLMTAIAAIVEHLDAPEELARRLRWLGEGHGALGVEAAHFRPFGAALSLTIEDMLGNDLPPGAIAAWQHAYAEIAAGMIAGVAKAPGARAAKA